ncbi:rare lipoprotein A-like double-psi beta-barrel protein [Rhizoctonia solani 123E]|uniref:Rare lipoprotein A-like double-psi beta-barrel protein n=1 Tax=Rhizoctonia solani 123E TaxID=1423351 RepID=A0A074S827_9AGAM|nr:rare lipoprotein A-like double-psi beta-barrel protein [Rhizoctonia solani 123E]
MYIYKTLAIIGVTCATASALAVPNVLPPELWPTHLTDQGSVSTLNALEGRGSKDIQVGDTKSHSYDNSYEFRSGDGWESTPVTDLSYKYGNATSPRSGQQRRQRSGTKRGVKLDVSADIIGGTASHAVGEVWNELKGLGKAQGVTITWYTGEDLQNPSCWPESDWAPTDASFACALTLQGWNNKPSCFKFLELCNGPDKCIFVRVVDTCAGCKKGSRHVDLTKAAFSALADPDVGILTVQMRMATGPRVW